MSDEVSQILAMLNDGKITADEAEKLINALRPPSGNTNTFAFDPGMGLRGMGHGPRSRKWRSRRRHRGHGPRFLRIVVDEDQEDGKRERVNIKVPLKLLRAGISLGGLMPKDAKAKINEALKAKGIEVDPFSLEGSDADEIIEALSDLEINADDSGKKIRIHVAYDEDETDHNDEGDVPSDSDDVDEDFDFDVDVVRKVKKGLKKTLKRKLSDLE
ncbi:MAG: hypothetical protein HOB82_02225 [Alphaproteobacteria bacterium]|jgi:hypothetical protein|nr:hypothetical protein [Alphaproteobacteria bacterium]MBT4710329.1 hypothetical protein [Alphaproteobacteria bacterium]MBT5859880.1 hypothetical protein [Alphaproteobacteria bacterium]